MSIGKLEPARNTKTCEDLIRIHNLQAENAKLRAELESLRPKPVVTYGYMNIAGPNSISWEYSCEGEHNNLKLTFHDGKLVSAEVINA